MEMFLKFQFMLASRKLIAIFYLLLIEKQIAILFAFSRRLSTHIHICRDICILRI